MSLGFIINFCQASSFVLPAYQAIIGQKTNDSHPTRLSPQMNRKTKRRRREELYLSYSRKMYNLESFSCLGLNT